MSRNRRVGGWRGDVVRVWCQPGAGILQCQCDSCKILVAIMEQLNAIKAHDVRTSAGNIVRPLCDSFTMYMLQSCTSARFKDHLAVHLAIPARLNSYRAFISPLPCKHLALTVFSFCIWNAAVRCQQLCDYVQRYLELPCDGIFLAVNCPPWASVALRLSGFAPGLSSWLDMFYIMLCLICIYEVSSSSMC